MKEANILFVLAQQTMPDITPMYWVMLVSRIFHILGAIILLGGIFYLRAIVTPSVAGPAPSADQLFGGRRAACPARHSSRP